MRFKVGDKVRIREDLEVERSYGNSDVVPSMSKYFAKTATVEYVEGSHEIYELDIDGGCWAWTDEMLEPALEEPRQSVLRHAIDVFGEGHQARKAIEEMGELIQALCKADDVEHIREEIADVRIMLDQLDMIYGGPDGFTDDYKIKRLKARTERKE